jgi:hypothetical protein
MILYVNGDSHSAGAQAVNNHAFARDDPLYFALGRQPHPDNLRVSYGCEIANKLYAILHCDAESAASNARIIRTTLDYINNNPAPDLLIIGWATWEREEWFINNRYYQVNASGTDTVPLEWQDKYKNWVIEQDDYRTRCEKICANHSQIYELHNLLKEKNIPHLFFNTFSGFSEFTHAVTHQLDWGDSYVGPYTNNLAYMPWLLEKGHKPVKLGSYHFGPKAHSEWAEFLYQNYIQKLLTL